MSKDDVAFWKAELLRISNKNSKERNNGRDDKSKEKTTYQLYSKHNAISIYRSVGTFLIKRGGGWSQTGRYDSANLIFTAHTNVGKKRGMKAGGINFAVLRNRAMVNCVRGYEMLTNKSDGYLSIQRYCTEQKIDSTSLMPETFVFRRIPDEGSDLRKKRRMENLLKELAFLKESFEKQKESSSCRNIWIIKPDEGHCGEDIELFDSMDDIESCVRKMTRKSGAVVQKYVERPLTVEGNRKFDIRAWVCVTTDFRVGLYREGVLRTSAVPYDDEMSDLKNRFSHLSNHCIAIKHPKFGEFEPTNEMWWQDFDRYLIRKFGKEKSFYKILYPQIREIARISLLSVRHVVQDLKDSSFRSFHLFGFDLLVTNNFRVLLLEVNSSPAVAADLMAGMTEDLVHFAIDPYFPICKDVSTSAPEIATLSALEAAKYLTSKQQLTSSSKNSDDEKEKNTTLRCPELPKFRRGFDLVYSPTPPPLSS